MSAGIRHVLLVDDEAPIVSLLSRWLARALAGDVPRLHPAHAPDAALEALDRVPRDERVLIVSDYNMGAPMTGLELIAEVARRRPSSRRILLSGYPADDFRRLEGWSEVDAFVAKPVDLVPFGELVRGLVRDEAPEAARRPGR